MINYARSLNQDNEYGRDYVTLTARIQQTLTAFPEDGVIVKVADRIEARIIRDLLPPLAQLRVQFHWVVKREAPYDRTHPGDF